MKITNGIVPMLTASPSVASSPLRWVASLLVAVAVTSPAARAADDDYVASDTADPTSESARAIDDDLGFSVERSALPKLIDGRFSMPPLEPRSTSFEDIGNGKTPDGFRSLEDRPLQLLPESGAQRDGTWVWSLADWAAPNTYSNPRYFEDRMLERHGHERFGCAQPLASGVRFFGTLPMLPYLMAIKPPCECEYTLGYYRPGSCAPMVYQRPPWDRRAILVESAAVATGFIAIP